MIEKILSWLDEQIGKKAKDYDFSTDWCALFVNKFLTTFGYTDLKGASVYSCTSQMKHFKNLGVWNDNTPLVNEPCIIYYDWDLSGDCDHVGIMVNKTETALTVIEGNTGGDKWNNTKVSRVTRFLYNTRRIVRGHVYLRDLLNISFSSTKMTVYYGRGHVIKDDTGKCDLIQHMLNVVNYAGLIEDGIIGDNTDIAIKNFQREHNLEVDGIVGDETLFKLVQLYFNIPLENFKIGT